MQQNSSFIKHEEVNDPSPTVEWKVVENTVRDLNVFERKDTPDVDKEQSEDEVSESENNDFEEESEAIGAEMFDEFSRRIVKNVERKVVENLVKKNDLEKKGPPSVDKEDDYVCEKAIKHDVESFEKKMTQHKAENLIIDIKDIELSDSTTKTEFQVMIGNKSESDFIHMRDAVAATLCTGNTVMMEAKDVMHKVEMVIDAIKVNTDEEYAEAVKRLRPYAVGDFKSPHIEDCKR